MKFVLQFLKFIVLIVPFLITIVNKILVLLGFIRLKFGMSEGLGSDLSYAVTATSRYTNQLWDVVTEKDPNQHHTAVELFFKSIIGGLKILKYLFLSIFSWRK